MNRKFNFSFEISRPKIQEKRRTYKNFQNVKFKVKTFPFRHLFETVHLMMDSLILKIVKGTKINVF